MTQCAATFEVAGKNSGDAISTADTGAPTAWSTTNKGASATITYDSTHVLDTLAAKIATAGTSTNSNLAWVAAAQGTITDTFGRFYVYLTGNPGAALTIFRPRVAAGAAAATLQLLSSPAGKLKVLDSASAATATSTNAVTLNQWVRIEWHYVASATVGSFEVKLFNSPDSTTATETIVTTAGANTLASANDTEYGIISNIANYALWVDNIVSGSASYPGPRPVNSVAPAVSGSAPVGSTLTCDGGTWNDTFTLTYQWTNAGSNIGGATSSTYVTVDADIGAAIGCKVTATGQRATNESATQASGSTITPTAVNPANSVAPVASGSTTVGSVLSVTNGTWTGDPTPTFAYQWQRDVAGNLSYSNISSATSSSYTLVSADNACHVRCVVTGTNSGGNASANSNAILDTSSSGGSTSAGPDPSKTASAVVILGL